ncbi:MAG: CtsR family transcriptional regulator [Eubacteriales bacterium]|nr:CtsR family transcriptional regulator [Eubacteriales bacterium]
MSLISDHIEEVILGLLAANDGEAKFKRSGIAELLECAPSQISYVIQTRFNYGQGYTTESRRGEGGYIIVRQIKSDPEAQELRHFAYNIKDTLAEKETEVMLRNLNQAGIITDDLLTVMQAVSSELSRLNIDSARRDKLRADLLRAMLMALLASDYGKNLKKE